jgi:hypothetical protein
MPILMVALIALAAFGLIGFLLFAAVLCERRAMHHPGARQSGHRPAGKSAA